MNDLLAAGLLGVVEGLTEFIPVSSTGHLILFGDAISFAAETEGTFEIFIQLGAILAVVLLYPSRFIALLKPDPQKPGSFQGMSGIAKLFVACLPAFILGPLLYDTIKGALFSPVPVAVALLVGGILLILVERRTLPIRVKGFDQLSYRQCLLIGLAQCFAMWPGFSRSGATILGGLLIGLERTVAAEFSFILAVPVMCAAVGFDLLKSMSHLSTDLIPLFTVGFLVSLLTGVCAIRFFIGMLKRYTMEPFGWYRILLGAVVLFLFL